ncbi:FkbM family methyltransferase [Methylobrevis pamukkalensis]|uniref:Methyltransferase FkbM domain-containing protein n=1 Tax=Methylobrevis pamukkalensis TaxID=1439726 RepID=A0A1E3H3V1_9HYPH|nr:FkbM family methyltransferase [Methylobrevis pamukkalensis]ODN70980.1 hypothetical protein A6302_01681 [Methylobrevis pamukkalensis]
MIAPAAALGLARSLLVYHGQPWRTRALRRFYGALVPPGALVFDIGAHVGNRSRILLAQKARVVAVEPQRIFHDLLLRSIGRRGAVVLRAAVGAQVGEAELQVSSLHPTVSTLAEDWRRAVSATPGFAGVRWDRSERVPVTTLDALVAEHGRPDFCKIDVEGHEAEILKGLSAPLPLLAVEYLAEAPAVAHACLAQFARLGAYEFNAVAGERHRFVAPGWVRATDAPAFLDRLCAETGNGDLYARLVVPPPAADAPR